MKNAQQRLAVWGESLAAEYFEQLGFRTIERNFRTPYGEIDLIVRKMEQNGIYTSATPLTVFVEVKTRSSFSYGFPEQAVTSSKRAHMLAAAREYIRTHPEVTGDWRVDVIAIVRTDPGSPPQIQHFENAITGE